MKINNGTLELAKIVSGMIKERAKEGGFTGRQVMELAPEKAVKWALEAIAKSK